MRSSGVWINHKSAPAANTDDHLMTRDRNSDWDSSQNNNWASEIISEQMRRASVGAPETLSASYRH